MWIYYWPAEYRSGNITSMSHWVLAIKTWHTPLFSKVANTRKTFQFSLCALLLLYSEEYLVIYVLETVILIIMATYEVPSDDQIAKSFIMAFVLGLAAMISYFFTDKEAEEERREQLWLSRKQVRDRNRLIFMQNMIAFAGILNYLMYWIKNLYLG